MHFQIDLRSKDLINTMLRNWYVIWSLSFLQSNDCYNEADVYYKSTKGNEIVDLYFIFRHMLLHQPVAFV